jgi:hypothetical protein
VDSGEHKNRSTDSAPLFDGCRNISITLKIRFLGMAGVNECNRPFSLVSWKVPNYVRRLVYRMMEVHPV